jgi:hypothetical protein
MAYSTTNLLARIRTRSALSGQESQYGDAVLLDLSDQVLSEDITPLIRGNNEDYYITSKDLAVTAGRNKYPIPSRSAMGRIHSVYLLNSAKDSSSLLKYTDQRFYGVDTSGTPEGHTIEDNSLVLHPIPSEAGYLRVYYEYVPSLLVATSACALITGGVETGILTGTMPGTWTTENKFDIVSAQSPFELVSSDLVASEVTAGTITFSLADIDTLRMQDGGSYYVTKAGETCFPMIPSQMHYCLGDLVACHLLEMLGDEGFSSAHSTAHNRLVNLANSLITRKKTDQRLFYPQYSALRYFSD